MNDHAETVNRAGLIAPGGRTGLRETAPCATRFSRFMSVLRLRSTDFYLNLVAENLAALERERGRWKRSARVPSLQLDAIQRRRRRNGLGAA
jgi:hypothetical protein